MGGTEKTIQTLIGRCSKREKMKKPQKQMLLQVILPEGSWDNLTKMMIGYVLNMPMNEKNYYEKLQVVVELLEQCLPEHPGAFAAYFRILDKFPATAVRRMPEMMEDFVTANWDEIQKYYEGTLPEKYRPKVIITQDKRLVDVTGNPIGSPTNFEVGETVDVSNMPDIIGQPLHDEINKPKKLVLV